MAKTTRTTKQKTIIESALTAMHPFFSAEDLLAKVQEHDRSIGAATVYRFLKEKSGKGFLHAYTCDRAQVYTTSADNHCHHICTKCGKKSHFRVQNIDFLKRNIQGTICHFQIDIHGVCTDCTKK